MTRPRQADVEAIVRSRTSDGDGVVLLELASTDGSELPAWEPGAHVDVLQPSGLVRQYSLCGEPGGATWRLGVLREESGRGGSAWLHDRVGPGDVLRLAGPRTHFAFEPGESPVLFVAGGIGITPIAPMAAVAAATGRDYTLHYAGHAGRMALVDELRARHGDRLTLHVSEDGDRMDLRELFADAVPGTTVYCCGPARLIDAAQDAAAEAGLEFRAERFEATLTPPVWPEPFEVELALSGITVEVPPERSILEVVEEHGVLVLSSCTEGTCGTCETPVLEGDIDHRDAILTPKERARQDVMFLCVSRAACPRLVLEL